MTLYFNPVSNVLYVEDESADPSDRTVAPDEVAAIVAGGATITPSAQRILPLVSTASDGPTANDAVEESGEANAAENADGGGAGAAYYGAVKAQSGGGGAPQPRWWQ